MSEPSINSGVRFKYSGKIETMRRDMFRCSADKMSPCVIVPRTPPAVVYVAVVATARQPFDVDKAITPPECTRVRREPLATSTRSVIHAAPHSPATVGVLVDVEP